MTAIPAAAGSHDKGSSNLPFNNRHNPHIFRDTHRRILTTGAMPYRELIGEEAA